MMISADNTIKSQTCTLVSTRVFIRVIIDLNVSDFNCQSSKKLYAFYVKVFLCEFIPDMSAVNCDVTLLCLHLVI
jgi:hypothetical protein